MIGAHVLTEWTGTVLRMTLDSANHVNALDAAMINELDQITAAAI